MGITTMTPVATFFVLIVVQVLFPVARAGSLGGGRCQPGHYTEPGTLDCLPCPVGTFSANGSAKACTKCPPNTYNLVGTATSATDCKQCPRGTYPKESPYFVSCGQCFPGEFGDKPGSCKMCPPGTSNTEYGMKHCIVCGPGTRSVNTFPNSLQQAPCEKCPLGTYNPYWRSSKCMKCPPGTESDALGVACITKCAGGSENLCARSCAPGFARLRDGAPCTRCAKNKVGIRNAATRCAQCPKTFVPNAQRSRCVCPPGTGEHQGRCKLCPAPLKLKAGKCVCLPPNMASATGCKCPAFTMLRGGRCVPCSKAEFMTEVNGDFRSDCVLCPMNERFDWKLGECVQCPPGTGLLRGQRGPCRKCAKPWTDKQGISRCGCRPGTEQIGFKCEKCPKGWFCAAGAGRRICEQGYFSDREGMAQCSRCPPGQRYSDEFGATKCPPKRK